MPVRGVVPLTLRASIASAPAPWIFDELVGRCDDRRLEDLYPAASLHGIAGYVHEFVRESRLLPPVIAAKFEAARKRSVMDHLRKLADIRLLDRVLGSEGIAWLVVKGPTLIALAHGRPELRTYGDLDVLVDPRRFGDALEALQDAGCVVVDRNWTMIHREVKGEVHLAMPSGTALDLHWHLINSRRRRQIFSIRTEDLLAGRRMVQMGGFRVATLNAVDTLLYIAIHTVHSGGHRLIWLKDLERLLASEAAEPSAVMSRAAEWKAEVLLETALRRVDQAMGSATYGSSFRPAARATRLWSSLIAQPAFRFSPAEEDVGKGSLGRIVARSASTTGGRSVARLAQKAGNNLLNKGGSSDGPTTRVLSAADPASDQYESGGSAALGSYLEAVANEAANH